MPRAGSSTGGDDKSEPRKSHAADPRPTARLEQQNVRVPARIKRFLDRLAVEMDQSTAQYCSDVLVAHVERRLPELADMLRLAAEQVSAEVAGSASGESNEAFGGLAPSTTNDPVRTESLGPLEQQTVRLPTRTKRFLDRLAVEEGKTTAQYCADVLIVHVEDGLPELASMLRRAAAEVDGQATPVGASSPIDAREGSPSEPDLTTGSAKSVEASVDGQMSSHKSASGAQGTKSSSG